MKFPITRNELQNYNITIKKEVEDREFEHIFNSFVLSSLQKKISQATHHNKTQAVANFPHQMPKTLLPKIIEKLREYFIDCNIIVDPLLESYVIIDWS
jgi:hypothetical protein